jgi:hypothetical protein
MVLSRFGGENSLSMMSLMPMIAVRGGEWVTDEA